ncbi:MAG: high-potential iron-sulfur protein [Bacteroidia bacterium]|nr:high-potential iron-sulfur protein [Bacteroidia bacterium]
MNRKNFLKSMALGAASTSILVAACGGDAPKTESTTAPAAETPAEVPAETAPAASTADCNDLSGLTEAEIKQRESVGYVTASTEADKNCANCRFMQEGNQPNGCSGCQLFKGPIVPEGYCKSWFKKEA